MQLVLNFPTMDAKESKNGCQNCNIKVTRSHFLKMTSIMNINPSPPHRKICLKEIPISFNCTDKKDIWLYVSDVGPNLDKCFKVRSYLQLYAYNVLVI